MRKHTLLIAVPAFLLGGLVTAGLTSTARAQVWHADPSKQAPMDGFSTRFGPKPRYVTVTSDADINKYAAQGYEVKFATTTGHFVEYLMQSAR